MAVTITPRFKAKLIIRFEDGTECEIGDVTYRPDIDVTINSNSVEYQARQ